MDINVNHNSSAHKFFAVVNNEECYMKYTPLPGQILRYESTFVPTSLRGKGIASAIVKQALAYAADNHFKVVATCSFVQLYIERHPQYKNLLAA